MPFPRLSNLLRRQRNTPPPSPRVVVSPAKPQRPCTPTIWGTADQVFTGVHDASWYDDLLDAIVDECAKGATTAQLGYSSSIAIEVKAGREVLFDADVWVELARAEEEAVRRCVGACKVRNGYCYGDADVEELRCLNKAFMGDYYDGECTCLGGGVYGGMCLPGETFRSVGSASLDRETSAGYVLLSEGEASVISETESIFDHMDEVVQGVLSTDAGVTEVSAVQYLDDRAHGMLCDPPTPWSMVTDVSECDEDAVFVDISDAEETLRSELPFPLYYFDADMQQYYGYTAFNQLPVCSKLTDTWSVIPKPSVRTGQAMGSRNMY